MHSGRVTSSGLSAILADRLSEAASWWTGELADLLSPRLVFLLTNTGARNLLITVADSGDIQLRLRDSAGAVLDQASLSRTEDIAASIDHMLKRKRLASDDVLLGISMPLEKFFFREIIVPGEARRSLDAIALKDLLYHTPFREHEIFHAYRAQAAGAKIELKQMVIRRALVENALAGLDITLESICFVENGGNDDGYPARIFLKDRAPKRKALRWLYAGMTAVCAVMALAALALEDRGQQARLAALSDEMAAVQEQAKKVRSALDAAREEQQALHELREKKHVIPGMLQIWEEISRILPDNSWVQEMRLARRGGDGELTLTLSGFSSAAATLVEQLDRSPLLSGVSLTAPVTMDPIEKRERFNLEARIEPRGGGN
jgi:general secretion pathway protein L